MLCVYTISGEWLSTSGQLVLSPTRVNVGTSTLQFNMFRISFNRQEGSLYTITNATLRLFRNFSGYPRNGLFFPLTKPLRLKIPLLTVSRHPAVNPALSQELSHSSIFQVVNNHYRGKRMYVAKVIKLFEVYFITMLKKLCNIKTYDR